MDYLKNNIASEENMNDNVGICITDGNSACVLGVNQSYNRITNIEKREICGSNAINLEEKGLIDHSAALMVLKEKIPISIQQKILRLNSKVNVTASPIFNHRGDIFQIISVVYPHNKSNLKIEEQIIDQSSAHLLNDIIFKSKAMQQVLLRAVRAGLMDSTVLISGESGVGKEVVARLIHQISSRKDKPFIKVNIAAIPEELFESELFGYRGGAFTGALKSGKIGLVQAANGGTLLLDEVSEIPLNIQVKLLRLLQNKEATPVGSVNAEKLDVRFIAATNRDLPTLLETGQFREDLFYRLNVVPIYIPPLRERKEDIYVLAVNYLMELCKRYNVKKQFAPDALQVLMEYSWFGNIREMQNIVERLVVLYSQEVITKEQVLNEIIVKTPVAKTAKVTEEISLQNGLTYAVDQFERQLLEKAFQENNFKIEQTAEALGVHRTTILRKLHKYGIQ